MSPSFLDIIDYLPRTRPPQGGVANPPQGGSLTPQRAYACVESFLVGYLGFLHHDADFSMIEVNTGVNTINPSCVSSAECTEQILQNLTAMNTPTNEFEVALMLLALLLVKLSRCW